ncbi:MAG: FkbM family methyltransferase [Acidobacteria bacterium]|nr:FkbM family methyltransferase [Acidobacteriota bacterium]
MNLLAYLRKLDTKRRDRKKRPEMKAFREAVERLKPGDVAIDCGANVGKYTVEMARSGATVYAFEPNPAAYEALVAATREFPLVKTFHAAVTATPGPVRLYLHKWSDEDPVYWSTGSSLIAQKKNVRRGKSIDVEGISLSRFIVDLDRQVRLLKMDVEGAEVAILNDLLDHELQHRIDEAYVEVHDRKVDDLAESTRELKKRLSELGVAHFRLDWR